MSFKLEAAPGKVIVKSDDFAYTGKLHIPETAKRRPTIGEIVAIGRGVGYYEEMETQDEDGTPTSFSVFKPYWQVGDKVAYGVYSGVVLKIKEAPQYVVLSQDEILCKIDGIAELEATGAA